MLEFLQVFSLSLCCRLPVKTQPYYAHFVKPNSRNKNMLVKRKYSRILLIGNNVADLITVKCELSSAKWCFQTFYKPATTESEYFGRSFLSFFFFFAVFFCQLDLCYRRLGNSWTVTWVDTSVKFNNLHQWGYVNFPPSSRVQTVAVMMEGRELLDVCCAMLLETVLRKSVNAISNIMPPTVS